MSLILEEDYDDNYEPTEDEIMEYAVFLGMDPVLDKEYFWIARESLKAPLPPNWKPCQSEDGNIYYFNFVSGESIWDHPCDEHYKELFQREKRKSSQSQKANTTPLKENHTTESKKDTNGSSAVGLLNIQPKKIGKELLAPIKAPLKPTLTPLLNIKKEPLVQKVEEKPLLYIKPVPIQKDTSMEHKISNDDNVSLEDQPVKGPSHNTIISQTEAKVSSDLFQKELEQQRLKFEQERVDTKRQHELELNKFQDKLANELKIMVRKHADRIQEFQKAQQEEIKSLTEKAQLELLDFKNQQEKEFAKEKQTFVESLQKSLEDEFIVKDKEIRKETEIRMTEISDSLEKKLIDYQANQTLINEEKLAELKANLESQFSLKRIELEKYYENSLEKMDKKTGEEGNPSKEPQELKVEKNHTSKAQTTLERNVIIPGIFDQLAIDTDSILEEKDRIGSYDDDLLLQLQRSIKEDDEFLNSAKQFISNSTFSSSVPIKESTREIKESVDSEARLGHISFIESNYSKTWKYLKDHREKSPFYNGILDSKSKNYKTQNARFKSLCQENSAFIEKLKLK